MKVSKHVYKEIMNTVGKKAPETGGILGSCDFETITHFYFDESGTTTDHSYTPDTETINSLLERWTEKEIYLVGFIHSHSAEFPFPSCMDLRYCERILHSLPHLDKFFMPIIIVGENARISAYVIKKGKNGELSTEETKFEII